MISIGAPKLISQYFVGRERGFAMGIYITGPGLGSICALTLTNSILYPLLNNEWRSVMIFYSLFVFLAGIIWFFCSLQLKGTNKKVKNSTISKQLEIYKNLLSVRAVQIILLMSVCIFFFSHGLNNWLPEILRFSGMTLVQAGYWAALPTIAGTIGSLLIPKYAVPNRRLLILVILILSASLSTICLLFDFLPILSIGLILQGISRGTLMTVTMFSLAKAMSVIPVAFSYSTYSGLTVAGVVLFGILKYNQVPNVYGFIGICLIVIGVFMVNYLGQAS